MSRRTPLREFQERLARQLGEATTGTIRHWLVLRAGGRKLLLPLTDAAAISHEFTIVPVPRAPEVYRGLANVRGNLVGIVDLGWIESGSLTPVHKRMHLLLLAGRLIENTALLVEENVGLRPVTAFEPDPGCAVPHPWHVGAYRSADEPDPWILIDAERLVANPLFYGLPPARQATTP